MHARTIQIISYPSVHISSQYREALDARLAGPPSLDASGLTSKVSPVETLSFREAQETSKSVATRLFMTVMCALQYA